MRRALHIAHKPKTYSGLLGSLRTWDFLGSGNCLVGESPINRAQCSCAFARREAMLLVRISSRSLFWEVDCCGCCDGACCCGSITCIFGNLAARLIGLPSRSSLYVMGMSYPSRLAVLLFPLAVAFRSSFLKCSAASSDFLCIPAVHKHLQFIATAPLEDASSVANMLSLSLPL